MQKQLLATVISSLIASQVMAADTVESKNQRTNTNVYTDSANTLAIGGRVGLETKTEDSSTRPANDSARINFSFEHKLNDDTTGFASAEWGYQSHNDYVNANGTTTTEGSLFYNRLGYLGISNDEFGSISIGKQWSVYYDVAGWTDAYAIGGGEAMGTYNGFTSDGGFSGTGRADSAIDYRGAFDGLNVGLQYQLADSNYNKNLATSRVAGDVKRKNSYQMAISYDFPIGISIGATLNEARFDAWPTGAEKQDLKSRAAVAGIKYDMDAFYLAATYGQFKNHTTATYGLEANNTSISADNMGFDEKSHGIELYGRYRLDQVMDGGFSLEAGWNKLAVDKDNSGDDSESKLDKRMLGVMYNIGPMEFAAEYTWNKGKVKKTDASGYDEGKNYYNLVARYYF
ncbi:MAG: porin [Endozoicomonas sp. (ex Botrylloides leachii)]|nr:porin [Endozoicomonas sp. (ex Botrylloides leachii)]